MCRRSARALQALPLALAASACGTPCEKAYDALMDCLEEGGIDTSAYSSSCDLDDGSEDEMFECIADEMKGADCSSQQGAALAYWNVAVSCGGFYYDSGI